MIKKVLLFTTITLLLSSCGATKNKTQKTTVQQPILVNMDLTAVKEDKLRVTIARNFKLQDSSKNKVSFFLPKIVPGTYSVDNYGKYIENLQAFSKEGTSLTVAKIGDNGWSISGGTVEKITYLVNDTYDIEDTHKIFSPTGTNIDFNKNFLLNLHGFVGYFEGYKETPYQLTITHPEGMQGVTSLNKKIQTENKTESTANSNTVLYTADRYGTLVDNPIMYCTPDIERFTINDIVVTLSVYSPNKTHTAASIRPAMEKMMNAQKKFLGPINATKKYNILLYLSTMNGTDANGFGALEHNTSTVVVLPEVMPLERLNKTMVDVVSHEFFHIVTPLNIHSKEIHFFDFINPKMSQHLWMYEGTTEYFAQLFQIQQGLISKDDFYDRLTKKVAGSRRFDDQMSFTEMSKNILKEPYKANYINVYEKGTLISMCLDIIIREKSNGEKGILDLMKSLSTKYGSNKPFDDDTLVAIITKLTYPEVGTFLNKHVVGTTPIPYETYWNKVGLQFEKEIVTSYHFATDKQPFITGSEENNQIFFIPGIPYNSFLNDIGILGGDILVAVNDKKYTLKNAYDLFEDPKEWKIGDPITFNIIRDGVEKTLNGTVTAPKIEQQILKEITSPTADQAQLRKVWMQK